MSVIQSEVNDSIWQAICAGTLLAVFVTHALGDME